MAPYLMLAQELFDIMDPQKRRTPHEPMSKMMHGEMAVMRLLEQKATELSAGEISRNLRMTTSRVASVLGSLERKGLIDRRADEADKRRVAVCLTEAGCAFNAQKREEVIAHMRGMLEQLGEHDAAEYVRLTRRVFELMHSPKSEGGVE